MAFDISLTAGMRADLISLQGTAQLLNRTQGRLSSGKQVNSAVDDPSKYFAAQDHLNHASDLSARKSDMGEAIQSVKMANQGITGITGLINQAQGLVNSAQSANTTTRASLAAQFNTLRNQIDQLASDSGYNGKNFLQGDSLNVLFNESGSSKLVVTGFQGSSTGLGITTATHSTGAAYTDETLNAAGVSAQSTVNLAHSGIVLKADVTVTRAAAYTAESLVGTGSAGSVNGKFVTLDHTGAAVNVTVYETVGFSATSAIATAAAKTGGTVTLSPSMVDRPASFTVKAGASTLTSGTDYTATFAAGKVTIEILTTQSDSIDIQCNYDKALQGTDYTISTGSDISAAKITFSKNLNGPVSVNYKAKTTVASADYSIGASGSTKTAGTLTFSAKISGEVQVTYKVNHTMWGNNDALQTDMDNLNNAITKLRTEASTMAANLSVITTRQDWSAGMISNLQTGSDNLTLADMNEEGANMLALQTRQQLGIQALSLASQANQSIMRLFG